MGSAGGGAPGGGSGGGTSIRGITTVPSGVASGMGSAVGRGGDGVGLGLGLASGEGEPGRKAGLGGGAASGRGEDWPPHAVAVSASTATARIPRAVPGPKRPPVAVTAPSSSPPDDLGGMAAAGQ